MSASLSKNDSILYVSSLPRCVEGLGWSPLNQLRGELYHEDIDSTEISELIQTAAEASFMGVD